MSELLRGRYEPLEVVGSGGEGEVIRALDRLHERDVALKVRRVAGAASREFLLSEARVLLSLAPHPGLPLVREDFFVDDRYVIAMDWIDGADLGALLETEGRPGLDPACAIGYLEEAAAALEHLHSHDPTVVHGDVKPANLILSSSGRVVLVDFGLSSLPADDARRAGTARFVAPEVAAGLRPTPAADVYSLAATALALLTGAPPGEMLRWGSIERERIPALERILRANLATDPARRDASAPAFVRRLARWWGAGLPRGTVTLVVSRGAEAAVDEIALAHGGHCVAPTRDAPLLSAFASAGDGFDAALELARRFDTPVAVTTEEAKPRAGTYPEARLEVNGDGQLLIDDATAIAIDGRLQADVGLMELAHGWAVVAPGLPASADECPYRGLLAYEREDGDLFFGREDVVSSVVARLADAGFMAIVGASGSGKSSLARAGIAAAWDGRAEVITPQRDLGDSGSLVVVDQFEEVFTLLDGEERAGFIEALMDLRATTAIAVVLRADFYGRCAEHPALAAAVAEHQHLLGPMSVDELRRAIEGPARAAGLRLEAGLTETLLADIDGEPGALPLLSHALYESWVRRDGRVLTNEGYRAAGGVRGAVAHTAESVFVGCSVEEQTLVRRMFLRLTTTEETRRRVPLEELVTDGQAKTVLERLARARLVVVGDGAAEIAHEALIREWPRLRGWLTDDREMHRALRQLTIAAVSWDEADRNEADLYRGPRLGAAAAFADVRLSRVEREFLDASEAAQARELHSARRRTRRLRALLAVVASALVAAVVAGALAVVQRGNARRSAVIARSGRLAAQSREAAAQHPDRALLLALEAGRLDDSVDTQGALLGAVEHAARIKAWLQGFAAPVNAATFSPDGKLLATVTQLGTRLWDTKTWRPVGRPLRSKQGGWEWADFSPDGRTLAIAGGKGRIELWDVATRKELRELVDPAGAALAFVGFSPNGEFVAAGSQDANHVTLWHVATGRAVGPLVVRPRGAGAQWVAFSPDSKRIAVPGAAGAVGIRDVATGQAVRTLSIGSADVDDALFADDGRTLIASDDSGAVSFVEVAKGRPRRPPLSVGDTPAGQLALSPDGRLLAADTFAGSVFVWDTKTGKSLGPPLVADTTPMNDVEFSPDGRTLVTSHIGSAVVWHVDGEQAIGQPIGGPTDVITDVAFSPDGKRFVAARFGRGAGIYDTATRRLVVAIRSDSIVSAVAFARDGKRVAVGTVDGRIRFVDPRTGAASGPSVAASGWPVWQLAFSPDGRLLAAAVDPNGERGFEAQKRRGEVRLFDVRTGRRVGRRIVSRAGSIFSVAFSRDGKLLATGSRDHVDLWAAATQVRLGKSMQVPGDGLLGVAFDPTGALVAAGAANGPVHVWRVADQSRPYPPLGGHLGPVEGVAFDPSGSFFASSSVFGGTLLWDAATGLAYAGLDASAKPASLRADFELPFLPLRNAFSPDGKLLAVSGVDTRATLWQVDPAVWRRRACAIAGRNLSREEWKLYLPAGKPYRTTCPQWPAG